MFGTLHGKVPKYSLVQWNWFSGVNGCTWVTCIQERQQTNMGLVRIMSWYPNFNGSHFGLPPSEIHRLTGLGGKMVWTMTYSHRPHFTAPGCTCVCYCTDKSTPLPQKKVLCHKIQVKYNINNSKFYVDGDLAESIKRSASDWLGNLVPQVWARTSPGFFTTWRFQALNFLSIANSILLGKQLFRKLHFEFITLRCICRRSSFLKLTFLKIFHQISTVWRSIVRFWLKFRWKRNDRMSKG